MDWLAGILELLGCWLAGNKKRACFIVWILCGGCWIYVAVHTGVYGLLLISVPNIAINVRNFIKWGK